MIYFKQQVSKKEKKLIESILGEFTDLYGDFYITKDNLRLFIKENIHLLYECLKKGDKITFSEEEGIIFITGWSDKAPRKYLKILAKNEHCADRLLKATLWRIDEDLFIKLKKNNPLIRVLENNNFRFLGNRGKEILFCRKKWVARPTNKVKGDNNAR